MTPRCGTDYYIEIFLDVIDWNRCDGGESSVQTSSTGMLPRGETPIMCLRYRVLFLVDPPRYNISSDNAGVHNVAIQVDGWTNI